MEDDDDIMRRKSDPRLAEYDPPPPPGLTWASAFDVLIHARDVLTLIVARFWSPFALGKDSRMSSARRREFLSWLRPVELMLRRLLFIEASALAATLAPAPLPAARTQPPASTHADRQRDPPSTNPEDWAASFRVAADVGSSPHDNARTSTCAPRYRAEVGGEDTCDARSLAVRLEAMLRVVSDLTPHICRLAVRIQRTGRRAFKDLVAPAPCHNSSMRRTLSQLAEAIGPIIAADDSS